jgi:glycosyltransferase involved in cell wall biosynthesis
VLTIDEPIDPDARLAGLQVRVLETARALGRRGCDVAILGAGVSAETGDVGRSIHADDVARFDPDLWICHPLLLRRYRRLLGTARLALDCYEMPFASFLNSAVTAPPARRCVAEASYRRVVATYRWALGNADVVITANSRQQASVLTLLALFGLLDPLVPVEDRVIIVPSGVPPDLLVRERRLPLAVDRHEPVVLWAGGAYPWFDVANLARSCELVLERLPTARFVFAGVHGRDEALGAEQVGGREIHDAVQRIPRLAERVEFVSWVPYRERAQLYARADVAISVHGLHAETYFSMRARVLDYVGAALPLVVTGGDTISEMLASEGAARVVPPGDANALARAVVDLLENPAKRLAIAAAMRRLTLGAMSWNTAIEPLLRSSAPGSVPRRGGRSDACPEVVSSPPLAWRRLQEVRAHLAHRARRALTASYER